MPGFVTDAELKKALADQLQKTGASPLEPWWDGLVTRANAWAYGEIVGRLAERGYLPAQIDAWDRISEFQLDLGCWRAVAVAAAMQPDTYSLDALGYLDRRKELTGEGGTYGKDTCPPVAVLTAGVFQAPKGTAGQVVTCPEDTTGDLFQLDPADGRRGRVTVL